ncbi:MAG TPA: DUF362 domain-containing protein [Vicinamibacterales bacterium]|nr:DUF362 domain-containing protein [Vicinamibacterales bacterium]HOG29153.1 DUF362 domain-containing protein [Vicinamibacterales bacterium]HOQ59472.1 DUF362 domain-containing protein [Vicinamibacterales bacterium]HPW19854.1 DUF362 domain-containing protein [Vicinamibacterales bacterium]
MTLDDNGLTRRGFFQGVMGAAVAAAFAPGPAQADTARARVVRVESPGVWKGDARRPEVVAAMIGAGLMSFTGESKADAAWRRFVKPGMRVGVKLNLLGRPLVITAREVTDAVVSGALAAGVRPEDLTVWDRKPEHFGPDTYQPGTGRHGERIKTGSVYHDTIAADTSGGKAPIDRIPIEETDVTINLPVIKDHGMAGVTGALKNIAFGCYRNTRTAHSGNCDPYIAETCEHFYRVARVPLIVLDATEGCFDQGPAPSNSQAVWRENAIYVATDPVALDVVMRDVIHAKRVAAGLPDVMRRSRHIETAAGAGLGVGDRARIDLVTVRV